MVALTLFGFSGRQSFLFLGGSELFLAYSFFFRALPQNIIPLGELIALYIPNSLLFIICNYFVVQVIKSSSMIYTSLKSQEEAMSKRYKELNALVESFNSNLNLGNDLHDLAKNTRDNAENITERVTNMMSILQNLTEMMASADKVQQEIFNAGQSVGKGMESQTSAISTSSAAVEEMAESITMISGTMKARIEALNRLKESSSQSEKQIKESGRLMDEMMASNSQINSITAVIEDVGSQTNLLAMNASIEAAHAGEVGKGFSVVAGEIRKLAETTNKQSKQIQSLLQKSNINSQSVVNQSREVLNHFEQIMDQIDEQAISMNEVFDSLNELSANAREITGGVNALKSTNSEVNHSVDTMSTRIEQGHGSIKKTADMAHDVYNLAAVINKATESLVNDSRTLAEIGQKNTNNQKKLESELHLLR
jgi:methyl-accepting chemotaxis protein